MKRSQKSVNIAQKKIEEIMRRPVAVHRLTIHRDGAHIKSSTDVEYTAIYDDGEITTICEEIWEKEKVRLGRSYQGTLETGGGKHNFYGFDSGDILELVKVRGY